MLTLSFEGMFRLGLWCWERPQYLMNAILECAIADDFMIHAPHPTSSILNLAVIIYCNLINFDKIYTLKMALLALLNAPAISNLWYGGGD